MLSMQPILVNRQRNNVYNARNSKYSCHNNDEVRKETYSSILIPNQILTALSSIDDFRTSVGKLGSTRLQIELT